MSHGQLHAAPLKLYEIADYYMSAALTGGHMYIGKTGNTAAMVSKQSMVCFVQVTDEAPSSVNFWSRVPSPSNIQSSQSSVLEGLGSAPLPIDQLQLKAAAFPSLSAPQQTSPLSAPQFWVGAGIDSRQQMPTGAAGMQGSSQTPWLSSWSQSMPVSSVQPKAASNKLDGSECTLKRERSKDENGEPVDSKPCKRMATEEAAEAVVSCAAVEGDNRDAKGACVDGTVEQNSGREQRIDAVEAGADTGSPNNSSHSSSPEHASMKEAAEPMQG